MADRAAKKVSHGDICDALRNALRRLRDRKEEALPESCAELFDDSLELIELLIVIEEELQLHLMANLELDWTAAPKRSATTTEFIVWIKREVNNG